MKKRVQLLFLLLLFGTTLIAQEVQNFSITGKIIDASNNQALEYATIILTPSIGDVVGVITDKEGVFNISVANGVYTITIEYLSYKPKIITQYTIEKDIDFGTVSLAFDVETLEDVEINGNTGIVNYQLNKKTYNVEKDILSDGGTATDVLANVPSVYLSPEGVPTIRGSVAKIMINGRVSARTKLEYLQNLPAGSIQKIEVITTPSARFGGDSSGGIINIILKRGLDNGFNGSVTTTVGYNDIYGVSTSLNYRKDKLNLYTNTSYFHRRPIAKTTIENEYTTNGITDSYLNESRKFTRKNKIFISTLGFDYYFNDYISLNIEGSYSNFNGDFKQKNTGGYFDVNNVLSRTSQRDVFTDHNDKIINFTIVYDQYFEREGEELYITFSHETDIETNNSELSTKDLFPTNTLYPNEDERIYDDLDFQNTNWYVAYILPIGESSLLEFGNESTLGNIKHKYINEIIVNGEFESNPNTSNILDYNENWYRFYAQYDQTFEKFSYGLGLSVEFTDLNIESLTTAQSNSQKYTDFIPSANAAYTINDTKSISFAYRRGLFRVAYSDLNPFEQRISETNSFIGNVNLLPMYENTFEISFLNTNENKKVILNPTLYFRNYNDWWQDVTYETGEIVNGVPKLITTPINLGKLNRFGIELNTSYKPKEWLSFTNTLDFYYVKQTGVFEYTDSNNQIVRLDYNDIGFGGYINLNTSIDLSNDYKFQALIQYDLVSEGAYSKREGYAYMNASMSKDLFNKQATLSLIASDVFNSKRIKRTRWTDDVISKSNRQWREQSFLLSFTYRFNQSKKDKKIDLDKKDEENNY